MLHLYVFVVKTTTGKMSYNIDAEDPNEALEKMAKKLEMTPAELSAITEELYEDGKILPLQGQRIIPVEEAIAKAKWRIEVALIYSGPEATVNVDQTYGPWTDEASARKAFENLGRLARAEPL